MLAASECSNKGRSQFKFTLLLQFLWVVFNGIREVFDCQLILARGSQTISSRWNKEREKEVVSL